MIIIGVIAMIVGGNGLIFGLIINWIAIITTTKDDYSVQISSNFRESKALTSKDKIYVQKIVDTVNETIIYQG